MESAKAEERLLNMDFVKAKAKQLGNRRQKAEVHCVQLGIPLQCKSLVKIYLSLINEKTPRSDFWLFWPASFRVRLHTCLGLLLMSHFTPLMLADSACVQEHGQVHHPSGYCAAVGGTVSIQAPLLVIIEHPLCCKMWCLFFSICRTSLHWGRK